MKIKLEDLVNSTDQIKSLLAIKLPIKVSYRIKRLADKVHPILVIYETKRNELISEFGEKNEDGSTQVKNPEKIKDFMSKIKDLTDIEEEIEWEPIPLSELGEISIEPKSIVSWIFTE